jgi:hypothetical protein
MQTKTQSFIEQVFNVGSGFVISLIYWQVAIIPYLVYMESRGLPFDHPWVAASVTVQFTIISVIRGYCWRRLFNYRHRTPSQPQEQ